MSDLQNLMDESNELKLEDVLEIPIEIGSKRMPVVFINRINDDLISESNELKFEDLPEIPVEKGFKIIPDYLRHIIIDSINDGTCTRKSAATLFNVPYSTIQTLYKKYLITGKKSVGKRIYRERKLNEEHKNFLQNLLDENCKYTVKELRDLFQEKYEMDIALSTIFHGIAAFHFNITRIDSITLPTLNLNTEEIIERMDYCEQMLNVHNSDRFIIYFGEAGFQLTMRQRSRPQPAIGPQIKNPTIRTRKKKVMVSMTKHELLLYQTINETAKSNCPLMNYFMELMALLEKRNIIYAVIIIDIAVFDSNCEIKSLIEDAGHLVMIIVPNCQNLNPVENVIGDWTKMIRSKSPKSENEMDSVIDSFAETINEECCNRYYQSVIASAEALMSENGV